MRNLKENERGAIIVEVIAVIALLGVLGPLLFRQVLSRNEEVENINIASEVRAVKEAFSAYILTNKQALMMRGEGCARLNNEVLDDYLPWGMEDTNDGYNLTLCLIGGEPNFLEGFIVPNISSIPEKMGLKRAARIANIIGADGGIYRGGADSALDGVAGGWHVTVDELNSDFAQLKSDLDGAMVDGVTAIYVATTGMDTYVPEYIVEDYSSGFVTIPDNLAFQKLHSADYFSVGVGGENCYTKKHNTMEVGTDGYTAVDDEIYGVGGNSGACDPLFWVGSSGETTDNSTAGLVYAKRGLVIGFRNSDSADENKQAVGIFAYGTDDTSTETSKNNRIEVYDTDGTARVIINGKGEVISKTNRDLGTTGLTSLTSDEVETLTLGEGALTSNIKAEKASSAEGEDVAYKIDPVYTSVMKDIRLESRGGARLSEILPNYISKTVQSVSGGDKVSMPACPKGYAPAIIVTPVNWEKVRITATDIQGKLKTEEFSSYTKDEDGSAGDHKHQFTVDEQEVKMAAGTDGVSDEISVANAGILVKIDSKESGYETGNVANSDQTASAGEWTVNFYYPDETVRTDVTALAQTYCVYDDIDKSTGANKYDSNQLDRNSI